MNQRLILFIMLLFGIIILSQPLQPVSAQPAFPIRMNAGGTTYTTLEGITYQADQAWTVSNGMGYIGGSASNYTVFRPEPIGNTTDPRLHQYQRAGWQEYRFSNIPNGKYLVILQFSEQEYHAAGFRNFDIKMENSLVWDNFDPASQVGRKYVLTRHFDVQVNDGELNITAQASLNRSVIDTISIEPYPSVTVPPHAPQNFTLTASYESILLDWDENNDRDIKGYLVYRALAGTENYSRINPEMIYTSHYIDDTVVVGIAYDYHIRAVNLENEKRFTVEPQRGTALSFNETALPRYQLEIDPAYLAELNARPSTTEHYPANLYYNGIHYPVEVRYQGRTGRLAAKKSWKIYFDDLTPFPEQDRIILKAEYPDWSMMRDYLSTTLFEQAGVPVSSAEHVALSVNGEYMGVYVQFEEIDKNFLEENELDRDGTLYRVEWFFDNILGSENDYLRWYEQETNIVNGHDDLIKFIEFIHETPTDSFPYEIAHKMDVPALLDYYAINIFTNNFEFVITNLYLLHDLEQDQWHIIPWDFDRTFGNIAPYDRDLEHILPINAMTFDNPIGFIPPNTLLSRVLEVPAYRGYYCWQMETYMSTLFTPANLYPLIDSTYARIANDVERDWRKYGWQDNSWFQQSPNELKTFITERRLFLQEEMDAYCPVPNTPYLTINELMPVNTSAVCDPDDSGDCYDSWFEIYNQGLTPINLQGMYLTDNLGDRDKYRINGSLVIPPLGHVVFWADNETGQGNNHTNFTLNAGNGVIALVASNGSTILAQRSYGAQASNTSNARYPDGANNWLIYRVPTPSQSNERHGPTISNTKRNLTIPRNTDNVVVTTWVVDDGVLTAPVLRYQVDGNGFMSLPMSDIGGNKYRAIIPPQATGTRVQYYVEARDNDNIISRDPVAASDDVFEYIVNYQPPTVYLNEFVARNDSGLMDPQEFGEYPDWVELYNPGPYTVDLGRLSLSDELDNPLRSLLPDELLMPAGTFRVFYADDDPGQGIYHLNFQLDAGNDRLGLFDNTDTNYLTLDALAFNDQEADQSRGRCPDGQDPWLQISTPTPNNDNYPCGLGAPRFTQVTRTPEFPSNSHNTTIRATIRNNDTLSSVTLRYRRNGGAFSTIPMSFSGGQYVVSIPPQVNGTIVEYYIIAQDDEGYTTEYPTAGYNLFLTYEVGYTLPSVQFNELVAINFRGLVDPQEGGERPDWIELHNTSDSPINLGGFYLTTDLLRSNQYGIPGGTTIPANGYLLFYADDDPEQGPLHTNFTLSRYGGVVALFNPNGMLVESVAFPSHADNQSYGRNLAGNWQLQTCRSPQEANECRDNYLPFLTH